MSFRQNHLVLCLFLIAVCCGLWASLWAQMAGPVYIANEPVPGAPPVSITPVTIDPSGQFVYSAIETYMGRVLGYRIDAATGALMPIPGSPFGAPEFCGHRPAAHAAGKNWLRTGVSILHRAERPFLSRGAHGNHAG